MVDIVLAAKVVKYIYQIHRYCFLFVLVCSVCLFFGVYVFCCYVKLLSDMVGF